MSPNFVSETIIIVTITTVEIFSFFDCRYCPIYIHVSFFLQTKHFQYLVNNVMSMSHDSQFIFRKMLKMLI